MEAALPTVTLYYRESGSGPPLLLLHGNGEDHTIFDELGERLERHFTLYAIDSRNHGLSSKTEDYSYATMAEDIYAFIKGLHLGTSGIVGFSDGAIIALMLALEHPDCLSKMALLGVNLTPEDFTEESYRYIEGAYEETHDPLFQLMLEEPSIEFDELRGVEIPTLVIAGEHDIFRPELYPEIVATLPHARLLIMRGHDHESYIVHSDMLSVDLQDFFSVR